MKFEEKICCVVKSWTKIEKETETKWREKKKKQIRTSHQRLTFPLNPQHWSYAFLSFITFIIYNLNYFLQTIL